MRKRITIVSSVFFFFLLTGCWDKDELTEFGFVQAVAIDQTEEGVVELTTHFYNPSGGAEMVSPAKGSNRGINIKTKADSVFEAIRDIPAHLGRKAKWDHMRVILIGEKVARKQSVGEILDFYSRNHEPRATIYMMITEGKASEYLKIKPFIESTIGQQLWRMTESASKYSAKTSRVPLLDLAIELKNETGAAMVPYIYKSKPTGGVVVSGIALLKEGKMTGSIVQPKETQRLLMLINKYENGILDFPCSRAAEEKKKIKESLEVSTLDTNITPKIKGNEVTVRVLTKIKGSVGELRCSTFKTGEEEKQFEDRIKNTVEKDIQKMIAILQKRQIDAIGIGNQIYRENPVLWNKWKPTWDERFAEIKFNVDVEVNILNTGMKVSTPFSKGEE